MNNNKTLIFELNCYSRLFRIQENKNVLFSITGLVFWK